MFGFIRSRSESAATSPRAQLPRRRFIPGVETLERRDAPAALAFVSPASVYGLAAANGPSAGQARSLLASNSGNIASRSSGASQAYTSLTNYSGASSKILDTTTYANGQASTGATYASAWTTQGQGGIHYVWVRIDPTSGERAGQRVQVTLTPRFMSTIGPNNQGAAFNDYSFHVNGGSYLAGHDTSKGTETFQKTLTLNTTIGSSFRILFQARSYVGASNRIGNVATMHFSLGLSASSAAGGSSSGAGQYSAPAAPGRPAWSSAGGSNIYLRWNDVAGETRYVVQYWNARTGGWVSLGTLGANVTSVKINYGLGGYFRVGAVNAFGTTFSAYVLAK
jgi:hypothetical protein